MKSRRPARTVAAALVLGSLWAATLWFIASTGMTLDSRAGLQHWFTVDSSGQYRFTQDATDAKKYIVRRTDSHTRTAHFLFWPLRERHWGAWIWSGGPGGELATPPPPTKAQYAATGAGQDEIEGPPGFSHTQAAVRGAKGYVQNVYHPSGVAALLVTAYAVAGPLTLAIWLAVARAIRRRRIHSRAIRGLCTACGFPCGPLHPPRCPECGQEPQRGG